MVRIELGTPDPLGSSLVDEGVNFAVYAPDAKLVYVCLFDPDSEAPTAEYPMLGKTGHVWHVCVEGLKAGQFYGYRVDDGVPANKSIDKLLIDPYAKQISRACHWDKKRYKGDSHQMVPKSVVMPADRPAKPHKLLDKESPRIIYEAHVKGLTQLHPDVPTELRGTYLGASHPSVIEHLRLLGITTVQFLPCASFMPEPYITQLGLTNYWGYNPVNFFAVEPRYALKDPLSECQQMIRAYHDAGIEVIMDVVFNHTAEGGEGGPVLSFKGLQGSQAYLYQHMEDGSRSFINNSGCGNSINTAQPQMLRLIMDALRFWVQVIGVDGFRFDLAASLGRDPLVFSPCAAIFRAIEQDPVLRDVLLIAEPWDIGLGGYQVGGFPNGWRECNDKFRDTVRAFWRGDRGLTSDFATRLMGSRDIFHKGFKPVCTSVNMVTYHDGFTLHDVVTYAEKHNQANLEENRDGHSHNLSANYGHEGETDNPKINSLRERQKRNLFTTLLLSQGTPHILGGDELSRSQQGNNNAYCQDNSINWFNWQLDANQACFLKFCREVIALRNSSQLLKGLQLEDDGYYCNRNPATVHWYKTDGTNKAPHDWHESENQAFAVEIRGLSCDKEHIRPEHWLICVNASDDDVRFALPFFAPKAGWTLRLDTRYADISQTPKVCVNQLFLQAGKSIAIFTYSY
ncbi:glycogen debranching protein GlgX [Alteromonas facilis]|uniref:glycogen debranching protein GlgX n=1 Tax=Alteromonas facilis TaxID=2048004 RepID=UPI000C290A47|nr:glycogen debranching protein GlgX [Alteromonas facilis]